ncbi:pilus assembly protein PilM, partial [Candidatus Azambacteria bacterium]|nr:pilus assembly protein PilM [Candidatus Azambacteria bacterium]
MNISQLFYPTEKIVGIEISKQYIKAILLEKTKDKVLMRKKSYVDLPSGLILDHQIKDKKAFVEILNKFRQDNKEIFRSKNVILSIPSNFVFTYLSSFPVLDYENLNKAVNLSLATDMFFPDDVENVYYDWEEIPKEIPDKSEVFISFSKKENIDDYISAFSEAGFDLVAVEFGARSLARALSIFGDSVGLAVNILSDGINFSVIFKNKLLFSNFYKIPEIRSQEEFNALVKRKLSEVVNFYNTDQNSFGKIQNISVVFPYEEKKALVEFLKKETSLNFLDPAVDGSMLKETASSIDDFWISIFGTALRGLLPRESDKDISLMTVGTEESFKKRKLMSYMFLWGDISSVVVIFFSLLFAGSLFFMNMLLTDTKVKFS